MSNPPRDAAEARARFFARYGPVVGGDTWSAVQQFLGIRQIEPMTVEAWINVAEAVRDHAARPQREQLAAATPAVSPLPAPAPHLGFSFEVRDLVSVIKQLGSVPGVELIPELPPQEFTPDGRAICRKHGVPMVRREKQGDSWWSHNVGTESAPCYCKGYRGPDSPGWEKE